MFTFSHLRAEHEDVTVSDVLLAPLTDLIEFSDMGTGCGSAFILVSWMDPLLDVLFWGMKISPVIWIPLWRPWGSVNCNFWSKKQNFFSCTIFSNFWSSKPWIWIRIRIDKKCWIRILCETNADPQHWYRCPVVWILTVVFNMTYLWRWRTAWRIWRRWWRRGTGPTTSSRLEQQVQFTQISVDFYPNLKCSCYS